MPRNVFAGASSPAPRMKRVLIVFLQTFVKDVQLHVSLSTRRECSLPYSQVHTTTCGLPSLIGVVLQSVSFVEALHVVEPFSIHEDFMPQPMQPSALSARP